MDMKESEQLIYQGKVEAFPAMLESAERILCIKTPLMLRIIIP